MSILSAKGSISLRFNEIDWSLHRLGEQALLLQTVQDVPINSIHRSTRLIEGALGNKLNDLVPAYQSIAIFTDLQLEALRLLLSNVKESSVGDQPESDSVELPICYELGLDLEALSQEAQLSPDELISIHLGGKYTSLFIGFTPGFVYADGLDQRLFCPRKDTPRTMVPAGSVGIGGHQTGIYSLQSPGGWNIIGRTPVRLFDPTNHPPMLLNVGTRFSFKRITKSEFERWES